MSNTEHSKVLIIGGGAAGYTAAIYASRAMLEPTLVQGIQPGGQLTITTEVENYPGFAEAIQGPWLMEQMEAQARHMGTKMVADTIVEADLGKRPFRLKGDSGTVYTADAVIIATGAQAKWLGIPSEQKFQGFGVSACATCDGFFYRGKEVLVVGGGNSAVEEALYLSNIARSVTVIHRRNEFRAERILQERLFRKENVRIIWDTVVEEILGAPGKPPMPASANGLRLRSVTSGTASELDVDGVFVAICHAPAVELFVGKLRQKPNGYLWTEQNSTRTDVPGVFAAGDVTDDIYRQAVTAAGLGCMAALEAEKYLAGLEAVREAAE